MASAASTSIRRVKPAELARELGVSRQAVHDLIARNILSKDADGKIDAEMAKRGWAGFKANSRLKNRGKGENFRAGWIETFGWKKSLEIKIATAGLAAQTSAESLLFEVESIRKKIFMELETRGVGAGQKDLIYQHDKYVSRSTEILDKLNDARDNYGNFVFYFSGSN